MSVIPFVDCLEGNTNLVLNVARGREENAKQSDWLGHTALRLRTSANASNGESRPALAVVCGALGTV